MLDRNALLAAMELKREEVEIAGGTVLVSEIGATDLINLYTREDLLDGEKKIDMAKFTPALVAYAVVDEQGTRIFSDADIPALEKASPAVFTKLSEAAKRLNGLTGEEQKN